MVRWEGIEFSRHQKIGPDRYRLHGHNLSFPRELRSGDEGLTSGVRKVLALAHALQDGGGGKGGGGKGGGGSGGCGTGGGKGASAKPGGGKGAKPLSCRPVVQLVRPRKRHSFQYGLL